MERLQTLPSNHLPPTHNRAWAHGRQIPVVTASDPSNRMVCMGIIAANAIVAKLRRDKKRGFWLQNQNPPTNPWKTTNP